MVATAVRLLDHFGRTIVATGSHARRACLCYRSPGDGQDACHHVSQAVDVQRLTKERTEPYHTAIA